MSVGKTENNFSYIVPHRLRGRRTEIKENGLTKLASENRSEKRVRQKSTWGKNRRTPENDMEHVERGRVRRFRTRYMNNKFRGSAAHTGEI